MCEPLGHFSLCQWALFTFRALCAWHVRFQRWENARCWSHSNSPIFFSSSFRPIIHIPRHVWFKSSYQSKALPSNLFLLFAFSRFRRFQISKSYPTFCVSLVENLRTDKFLKRRSWRPLVANNLSVVSNSKELKAEDKHYNNCCVILNKFQIGSNFKYDIPIQFLCINFTALKNIPKYKFRTKNSIDKHSIYSVYWKVQ